MFLNSSIFIPTAMDRQWSPGRLLDFRILFYTVFPYRYVEQTRCGMFLSSKMAGSSSITVDNWLI